MTINTQGRVTAPIVVVCDIPHFDVYEEGKCLSKAELNIFAVSAKAVGLQPQDIAFISPSEPLPESGYSSEAKVGEWLNKHRAAFLSKLHKFANAKVVVSMGKDAGRQVYGSPIQITKVRGSMHLGVLPLPVLPIFSPRMILIRPQNEPVFTSDLQLLGSFKRSGWEDVTFDNEERISNYEWVTDLKFLLDINPKRLVVDTETVGLRWANIVPPRLLTVQLCYGEGKACAVPMDSEYYDVSLSRVKVLKMQLCRLLSAPGIKLVGHNFKFDTHVMRRHGIRYPLSRWFLDTMQLAWAADENMEHKSLDHCVRRWVPPMAGYADAFNEDPVHFGKTRMDLVPHDKMLAYGCGDVDATWRLASVLVPLVKQDERQWRAFLEIQMRVLRSFVDMEEVGLGVDTQRLTELGTTLDKKERELYSSLIKRVPAKIKRKHLVNNKVAGKDEGKVLSFSRREFVADILFSKDGYKLDPMFFTPSSIDKEEEEWIPTVGQGHLAFFKGIDFVRDLIAYQKIQKMRSTYVGKPSRVFCKPAERLKGGKWPKAIRDVVPEYELDGNEAEGAAPMVVSTISDLDTYYVSRVNQNGVERGVAIHDGQLYETTLEPPRGFWQYLEPGRERVYPTFLLDRTVTGRAASKDPNGQNIPNRGELAKEFRRVFVPTPGYLFLEGDYSQIELRIAAWTANEQTMLEIYRRGGDIHCYTAAKTLGIPLELFMKFADSKRAYDGKYGRSDVKTYGEFHSIRRYSAKAVNFGFIYGMGWATFINHAKSVFDMEFTEDEAKSMRNEFFKAFPGLRGWHEGTKNFVRSRGYVRAVHGTLRRLPTIRSQEESVRAEAERQGINSPVQRFASDLALWSLARFARDANHKIIRPCGAIHDSIIMEYAKGHMEEAASALRFYMENPPLQEFFDIEAPIPLVADVKANGADLASLEKIDIEPKRPEWYRPALDRRPANYKLNA